MRCLVRLWVDLEVEADDEEAAKAFVRDVDIDVRHAKEPVPIYEVQTASVFQREE